MLKVVNQLALIISRNEDIMILHLPDERLANDKLLYYLYEALQLRLNELGEAVTPAKKQEEKPIKIDFDFEAIYTKYPRKLGKARGMKKLASIIKSQKIYDEMMIAVENYALTVRDSKPEFIKLFSTFVNGDWQDYVPNDGIAARPKIDWGF